MPKITFLHTDGREQTIAADEDWSIMQVALEHKVEGIEGACGGAMACATCHVYIHPDWIARLNAQDNEKTDEEDDMLDMADDIRETSRLGCQIQLTPELDGLIVALPGAKTNW